MTLLSQLRKGTIEICILKLIQDGVDYGYDILKKMEELEMGISASTVYPILARFKKDRLVITKIQLSQTGMPRKYYTPTEKGNKYLEININEWNQFLIKVNRILSTNN